MTDNRIKYGEEKRVNFKGEICHDCGVKRGELHKSGCDVEECLYCGTQKISCDCGTSMTSQEKCKNCKKDRGTVAITANNTCPECGKDFNRNVNNMKTPSQILKEGLDESELAVFWNEIANNLPKSVERSVLGDEKIFLAFRVAYPKIKNYLTLNLLEAERERWGSMRKVHRVFECNGAHNGRGCYETWCDMENCNSKEAIEFRIYNQAIDDQIRQLDEEIKKIKELM